jgi:predicted phosphodiesterase
MRYALIADVHANIEALTAVLGAIESLGVQRVLCLGDVVGRFANPNECVDLLRARGVTTVAGNHDLAAVGLTGDNFFSARAKRSNAWTKTALTPATVRFLQRLPLVHTLDDHLLLVHAALHPKPNNYVYLSTSAQIARSLGALHRRHDGARVAFFGHTHVHGVHRMWTEGVRKGWMSSSRDPFQKLSRDSVYLVNPGSVGQPRDGDPRASFAVYDRDHGVVQFHRAAFDRRAAEEKARQAGLIQRGEEYLE